MPGRRGFLEEQLDGSRLADPCLTRHEHDAALAAKRPLEGVAQHQQGLLPPDQGGAPGVPLRGRARGGRRDEPVAAVLAGDEPWGPRVVSEDRAEVADVALDRPAIDDVRGPDRSQDLLLRHGARAVLEEHGEHPGGRGSEGHVGAVPGQSTRPDVEAEGAEVEHPRARAPFAPRGSNIPPDSTARGLLFHRPPPYRSDREQRGDRQRARRKARGGERPDIDRGHPVGPQGVRRAVPRRGGAVPTVAGAGRAHRLGTGGDIQLARGVAGLSGLPPSGSTHGDRDAGNATDGLVRDYSPNKPGAPGAASRAATGDTAPGEKERPMTRIARFVRAPQLATPVGGAPRRCLQSLRPAVLGALALLTCGAPTAPRAQDPKPAACTDTTPHTIRFVTVAAGVELEVVDWGGSGAPMVLLTGIGDNAHVYDQFAFQFTNFFRVIGITRRGYLPSSQPATGYDLPTRAADDIAVLDALGIDKAVFVGHSVAGGELSALGQSYPARVDKLVYLDAVDLSAQPSRQPPGPPSTDADVASLWALQAFMARMQGNREPNPAVCHRWMFDANGAIVRDTTPDFVQPAIFEGVKGSPPQWARIEAPRLGIFAPKTMRAKLTQAPWYWYLSDAQKKEFNRSYPPIVALYRRGIRKFARRNSANTVLLPGAPHYIYIQNEAEVVRSMRKFLGIL